MQIIDGKAVAEQVKQEIAAQVSAMVDKGMKRPHLAAILVGHDGGSETYVAAKVKACEVCGFKSTLIRFESDITEEVLLSKVSELNNDPDVDYMENLLVLQHADVLGQSDFQREEKLERIELLRSLYHQMLEEEACLQIRDLKVNGQDAMAMGIPKGPQIGEVLEYLLQQVIEEPARNEREYLMGVLEQWKNSEANR